jgi:hypothetical protein
MMQTKRLCDVILSVRKNATVFPAAKFSYYIIYHAVACLLPIGISVALFMS